MGRSVSANIGCSTAKGKYIFRLDADDEALPSRAQKQIAYLNDNPKLALVGSYAKIRTSKKIAPTLVYERCQHLKMASYVAYGQTPSFTQQLQYGQLF